MMKVKFIYKIMLTFNSTMLLITVYLIKTHYILNPLKLLPNCVSYLLYIGIPILLSLICLWSSRFLSKDSIECCIVDVEEANSSYLPSYLGYFFVALSINDKITLFYIFILLFLFTFHSQTLYFNPLFLMFGYKFYYISLETGLKVFIITKREISTSIGLDFGNLRRINSFTFIDAGRYR